jgi:pyruvate/2-oxoglutarate dehydrogenase complex dihydrolipoamide acyltransferase (E2) component
MKSFGVCVGLVIGLTSPPASAASVFDVAQATPAAPAAAPRAAAPPAAAAPAANAPPAAAAAAAKPKMKGVAKPKATGAKKVPSIITVENKRTVTLKGLQIALPGGGGKVIGKLAKEIIGGKTARVALKGAKGCEYDVKWEFEDAADESTADLCNDPRIVLTD